jgi:hypothetical protein
MGRGIELMRITAHKQPNLSRAPALSYGNWLGIRELFGLFGLPTLDKAGAGVLGLLLVTVLWIPTIDSVILATLRK